MALDIIAINRDRAKETPNTASVSRYRFRADLEIVRDGYTGLVTIIDARYSQRHVFTADELCLCQAANGTATLASIRQAFKAETGSEISHGEVFAFFRRLRMLGLLEGDAANKPEPAALVAPNVQQVTAAQNEPIATVAPNGEVYLQDAHRRKTLPLRITYPQGAGPFPIIIFSHGLFGSRDGYTYLARYWAEHGYVCIQPSHQDSLSWQREQGEGSRLGAMLRTVSTDKSLWIERAGDVSFVIDSLPLIPELAAKLDTTRIGVGGHSYGAFTSLIIAGAQLPHKELAPKVTTLRNPRVKAIIAISPQGLRAKENSLAFDDKNSFSILVPAMFMTGDRDETGFSKADARSDVFDYCPPGGKYFVSIFGANHLTFSGPVAEELNNQTKAAAIFDRFVGQRTPSTYGDDDEHRRLIERATTLFWDAYVKGDRSVLSFLQRDGLAIELGRSAIVRSR